ncbi:protein of unknown function [Methylococcus capsulatus]|uniref:Uncharacterized protein n=1 Tax=Methylococcus capsulatus TaxID=414 RepID=A0AA35UZS5_METCP|nr:protein of unknown function [Methylococcus capsulatus]
MPDFDSISAETISDLYKAESRLRQTTTVGSQATPRKPLDSNPTASPEARGGSRSLSIRL